MLDRIQHEVFCHEYLKDGNATQAAIRAGFSRHSANRQAYGLLQREDVRARVNELQAARLKKVEADGVEVIRALTAAVRADVNDIVSVQIAPCAHCWPHNKTDTRPDYPDAECVACYGDGIQHAVLHDTRMLDEGARMLYAGAEQTRHGVKVHLHDKTKFIEMLARCLSLFSDNTNVHVHENVGQRLIESRNITKR